MKILKSNKFAQKLIIILVVLLIFNLAIPKKVQAWDFGGILLKPISSLVLSLIVPIDTTLGLIMNGLSIYMEALGNYTEFIIDSITLAYEELDGDDTDVTANDVINLLDTQKNNLGTTLNKIFIGPDTIFSGRVFVVNANIFKTFDIAEIDDIKDAIMNTDADVLMDGLTDATSPRISYDSYYT